MIDLHSHILPGMDDGSKNAEETAALLTMLQQQRVATLAATPHFYAQETPEAFLKRRKEAAAQLPPMTESSPKLLLGAEVAYFSGMGNSEALIPLQIGETKLLLVELPFQDWSERIVEDVCSIPSQLGLIPVLAHVNRYPGRQQFPRYKEHLADCGVLFQCNAEAFLSFKTKRWALDLMKKGYIHFLGSDCHNVTSRPPMLDKATAVIEKKFSRQFLAQFRENARLYLENE